MATRRRFLGEAVGVGVAVTAAWRWGGAVDISKGNTGNLPRIKAVRRRDDTILRYGGNGDDFWATWANDDRQYVALQDGVGWSPEPDGEYNSRLIAVSGGPRDASFQDVSSYPILLPQGNEPRYYGMGTLAVDGRIYQYLSLMEPPPIDPSEQTPSISTDPPRWIGAKLIFSPDNGKTWCNQDGTTPVKWESRLQQSRKTMVFYREPQEAFSLLSILQMGKDYAENRDGYVYVYATNGNIDGLMNQLVMYRVRKTQVLKREAYEYYAGSKTDGTATWTKDTEARAVVHTFPRGWVNSPRFDDENVLEAWLPSVVYNAPLGLYLMANWGVGCSSDGTWFTKPSYLGFWIARNPWGPWIQIYEETAWTPDNDTSARCYTPIIAPKWIAPDGKSFWIAWTDYQGYPDLKDALLKIFRDKTYGGLSTRDQMLREAEVTRKKMPYYAFNLQRVDLEIG